jgi:predicted dehydrogenase
MKIGVLGLGFMGSTHLQGYAGVPEAGIAAVMDGNEARLTGNLSEIKGNLGRASRELDLSGAKRYRTVEEIIADPDVEAVDICLPTNVHEPAALAALAAGKHVLVEKPMALDGEGADRMCEAAERAGRVLMVGHILRFFPQYRALADLVSSRKLGAVRTAFFRRRTSVPTWGPWEFDKTKSGGGIFDLLIHDADMALKLFGVPEAISTTGHENMAGGIDIVSSEWHYPEIGSVNIAGGWHHTGEYPFSMEYTVIGDCGVAEFSSAGRPAMFYRSDGQKEELNGGGADPFEAELSYFVECCMTGRRPGECLPEHSALAVKATKFMVEARAARGEKIPCRF